MKSIRISNWWCVAGVALLWLVPSSLAQPSSNDVLSSIYVGTYTGMHSVASGSSQPLRDGSDKSRDLCKHHAKGCKVAVAEGGSAAVYVLFAGVFSFGAVILQSRRPRRTGKSV